MNVIIDGKSFEFIAHTAILDMIKNDSDSLYEKPLAAQIGGEVYSLRYCPHPNTKIKLLKYDSTEGKRVYERTLQFVFLAAVNSLFPDSKVNVAYTLGTGLYIKISNFSQLTEADVKGIKAKMQDIISSKTPLIRKRLPIEEAIAYFSKKGQNDKVELLKWRRYTYFDVYSLNDEYMDYYYGEMAPDTGYVNVFDIHMLFDALLLLVPDPQNFDVPSKYVEQKKLSAVFSETDHWDSLMECSTVSELNEHIKNGTIDELVRINEALHEKRYAMIADKIVEKKARAVLIAGPSSSGKTTSANRLSTQLRVLGQKPIMLSMDDYYLDRSEIAPDENGQYDFEHINTLDIERFSHDLAHLLQGEEVETPLFDFRTGSRKKKGRIIKLNADEPLIIEGIHALNPILFSGHPDIDKSSLFKIYVSALTTLNLDAHNRIRTTDVRLLRRLVRDNATRSTPVEETLSMWESVKRGEKLWIFPHQENADILLNTTLIYEIAVLKKYIYPLLRQVDKTSEHYVNARNLLKFLSYFSDADVEANIPPTSILREFIGGNTFYK